MAYLQCRFFSEVLGITTSMSVILPEPGFSQTGRAETAQTVLYPVLYLLHGMSDDDSTWVRRTSIERYASSMGLIVVMPQAGLSFYTDMAEGPRYWTFISEELPQVCRSFFPISNRREDTFAAGLSMGGYGAFKLAMRKPDQFCAAASLSGALNVARNFFEEGAGEAQAVALFRRIFGPDGPKGTHNDLLALLEELEHREEPMPHLYQCCGTEDFLHPDNLLFRDACLTAGLPLTYEESPGSHDWAYWDAKIQDVLTWLPLKNKG